MTSPGYYFRATTLGLIERSGADEAEQDSMRRWLQALDALPSTAEKR